MLFDFLKINLFGFRNKLCENKKATKPHTQKRLNKQRRRRKYLNYDDMWILLRLKEIAVCRCKVNNFLDAFCIKDFTQFNFLIYEICEDVFFLLWVCGGYKRFISKHAAWENNFCFWKIISFPKLCLENKLKQLCK